MHSQVIGVGFQRFELPLVTVLGLAAAWSAAAAAWQLAHPSQPVAAWQSTTPSQACAPISQRDIVEVDVAAGTTGRVLATTPEKHGTGGCAGGLGGVAAS